MSIAPVGRASPRWSVMRTVIPGIFALPAPMAGLPAKRAIVWVEPPLLANPAARSGTATLIVLPLPPLAKPPAPPMPIRLYALPDETGPPAMSSYDATPVAPL